MITLVQVSYILSLLEHENFQKAADACHVTQPTLSMQLKKTEETIGFQLFNRDTSPISLTKEGEQLLPYLQELKQIQDQISIEVEKLKGTYKAEIKIGIIPTISSYLVPELYSKWKTELGEINLQLVELTSEKLLLALEKKEIDVGIMAGPLPSHSFQQQILYNEEIKIFAPTLTEQKIQFGDLEDDKPWLLSPGNCLRTQMINFCKLEEKANEDWSYTGGNLHLLIKMVKQEGGYTLVPEHYLPYLELDTNDLKTVDGLTPYRQIVAVYPKRNTKEEDIIKIVRVIQRSKQGLNFDSNKAELLPWDK